MIHTHRIHFLDSLVDEDERDENGKYLLGETGDVADEEASFQSHRYRGDDTHPHADPAPERQELNFISITELQQYNMTEGLND